MFHVSNVFKKKTRYSSVKMKIFLNIRKTPGRGQVAGGMQEGRVYQPCDHCSKMEEPVIKFICGETSIIKAVVRGVP